MAIKLTKHCTEVDMGICQSFRMVDFKFEVECLNEIGEGCADFASSPVVTSHIVIGG